MGITPRTLVALRKESVDRNVAMLDAAWGDKVALRKESVDRNGERTCRRAREHVALRKESVDRNATVTCDLYLMHRRSPQGERG